MDEHTVCSPLWIIWPLFWNNLQQLQYILQPLQFSFQYALHYCDIVQVKRVILPTEIQMTL